MRDSCRASRNPIRDIEDPRSARASPTAALSLLDPRNDPEPVLRRYVDLQIVGLESSDRLKPVPIVDPNDLVAKLNDAVEAQALEHPVDVHHREPGRFAKLPLRDAKGENSVVPHRFQ